MSRNDPVKKSRIFKNPKVFHMILHGQASWIDLIIHQNRVRTLVFSGILFVFSGSPGRKTCSPVRFLPGDQIFDPRASGGGAPSWYTASDWGSYWKAIVSCLKNEILQKPYGFPYDFARSSCLGQASWMPKPSIFGDAYADHGVVK